jgi:hypothetical protein
MTSIPLDSRRVQDWESISPTAASIAAKMSATRNKTVGDGYRTVFITFTFVSNKTKEEVERIAIQKFLMPELEKLDKAFEINGNIATPSVVKLLGPVAVKALVDLNATIPGMLGAIVGGGYEAWEKLRDENENKPPFSFCVYVFPTIAWPDPTHLETESDVLCKLRAAGVQARQEGEVGPEVVLE